MDDGLRNLCMNLRLDRKFVGLDFTTVNISKGKSTSALVDRNV